MKGFSNLRVKSAIKSRNVIDLSADHLTTLDFGQIVPLKAIETVPGGEYPINGSYFSRMAPLVAPTYGKFSFNTLAGFVPYNQIAVDSDPWILGKTSWEGQVPLHRYFTVLDLFNFLKTYCFTTTGATSSNATITYTDSGGTVHRMICTDTGRYWLKILNCLGYAVPEGVDLQSGSYWASNIAYKHLSAYPLLAFFKLYNDYMSQSSRFNTSNLSYILQQIKYLRAVSGFTPSTGQIAPSLINSHSHNSRKEKRKDY